MQLIADGLSKDRNVTLQMGDVLVSGWLLQHLLCWEVWKEANAEGACDSCAYYSFAISSVYKTISTFSFQDTSSVPKYKMF